MRDGRPISSPCSIHSCEMPSVGRVEMHDGAGEGGRRRTGRRVFVGRRAGHDHAHMEGAFVVHRLAAIDIRAGEGPFALARRQFRPGLVVQLYPRRRFEIGDRDGHVGHAGRPERDAVVLEADLVRRQAKCRADRLRIGGRASTAPAVWPGRTRRRWRHRAC